MASEGRQGLLLAIEGGDGSGKATQSKLLTEYLSSQGFETNLTSFPRYGEFSAIYVERYLNNAYGKATKVPADLASLPFAIDRLAAAPEMNRFLEEPNSVLVLDRSTVSNMAHQGTKFSTKSDRLRYYEESMKLEYGLLNIPKPDVFILLLMPSSVSQKNVDKKSQRNYTDKKRDGHEADAEHLELAKRNYEEISKLFPNEFIVINCMDEDSVALRSIEDIQDKIRQEITPFIK